MTLQKIARIQSKRGTEISDRDVCAATYGQPAAVVEAEPARRTGCGERSNAFERQAPLMIALVKQHGQSGLYSGYSAPCLPEVPGFPVRR